MTADGGDDGFGAGDDGGQWGQPIRCRQRPRAAGATDLTPAMSVGGGAYDPTLTTTTGGGSDAPTACDGLWRRYKRSNAKNPFLHAVALVAYENRDFCRPFGVCGWHNRMQKSFWPVCKKGFRISV
uniref:Uncharacterized protein n=1 Tax=Oryza barthii TaxID=65489 RepID=A0A0D3HD35_9ORYZ